jgi:hypothetical protein
VCSWREAVAGQPDGDVAGPWLPVATLMSLDSAIQRWGYS